MPWNVWPPAVNWTPYGSGTPPASWRWQKRQSRSSRVRSRSSGWIGWRPNMTTCGPPSVGWRRAGPSRRAGSWAGRCGASGVCAAISARDGSDWRRSWRWLERLCRLSGVGQRGPRPSRPLGPWPPSRATTRRRAPGDKLEIANLLSNLGIVARRQGNYAHARALYEESLALRRELGDKWGIATSLNALGLLAHYLGDNAAARGFLEESLALRRELGDAWAIANSLSSLGDVVLDQGDYATARARLEESLAINQQLGDRSAIAYVLEEFAGLAAVQGQSDRTLRLAGAAAALREAIGSPLSPIDQAQLERRLAPARQALGEATAVAMWAEGQAIPLEQAVAYTLAETAEPVAAVPPPAPAPPPVASVTDIPAPAPDRKLRGAYPAGLTSREVEVLRLVAQGLTYTQIAERLVISPRTVNHHLTAIYSKLGVSSRHNAMRFALDHDLV